MDTYATGVLCDALAVGLALTIVPMVAIGHGRTRREPATSTPSQRPASGS